MSRTTPFLFFVASGLALDAKNFMVMLTFAERGVLFVATVFEASLMEKENLSALCALPSTREEAIETGSVHYFTGEMCIHGHLDKRYTSGGDCAECSRLKSREAARRKAALIREKRRQAIERQQRYNERQVQS